MRALGLGLVALFMGFLVGCTKCSSNPEVCAQAKTYSSKAAAQFGQFLGCAKPDAIEADFVKVLEASQVCQQGGANPQGPVANLACGPLVDFVVSKAASSLLPAAWQCDGGAVAKATQAALNDVCLKIPF